MSEINPTDNPQINPNAVSVYGQGDALEDFPVLKAFQQYVDNEQAKARKRMLILSAFFVAMMLMMVIFFVVMLLRASDRNQALNDKLFEYAMRNQQLITAQTVAAQPQPQPVSVQVSTPTTATPAPVAPVAAPQSDNAAIAALTAQLQTLRQQMADEQAKAAKARQDEAEAKVRAERLALEKERQQLEKDRQRQQEIEAYRRQYYPELYETPSPRRRTAVREPVVEETDDYSDDALEAVLKLSPDQPSAAKTNAATNLEWQIPAE